VVVVGPEVVLVVAPPEVVVPLPLEVEVGPDEPVLVRWVVVLPPELPPVEVGPEVPVLLPPPVLVTVRGTDGGVGSQATVASSIKVPMRSCFMASTPLSGEKSALYSAGAAIQQVLGRNCGVDFTEKSTTLLT
jgi:hypothetical protein